MLTPELRLSAVGAEDLKAARPTWPVHLVVGWALAGLANLVFELVAAPRGQVQPSAVRLAHAVDFGRHVGLGMLSMAAVWLFRRYLPHRPALGWLALGAFSLGLGGVILPTDLEGLAERSAEVWGIPSWLAMAAVVVGIGGAVPALAGLTKPRAWGAGRGGRALNALRVSGACVVCVVAFWLNVSISPGMNPSAHLYLSWVAAIAAGHGLPRIELVGSAAARPSALVLAAAGVLTTCSLWALLGSHSNSVMIQIARRPSSLHLLAVFHSDGGLDSVQATLASRAGPFFASRDALPPIPPSPTRPAAEAPIVIFFSVDSLRADVLESAEHSKHLPNIVELAARGVHFSNARSPGSMTKYTLGAISSGKYFSQQYWSRKGKARWPFDDKSVHLAMALSKAGVVTAAFPATSWLAAGRTGLIKGFEQNVWSGTRLPGGQSHWIEGESLTAQLVASLEQNAGRPALLWVHYLDSHSPFQKGGRRGAVFSRYLRSLGVVDGHLGEVRAAVKRLGLQDRTLIVVASDHGEAFGEHDSRFHGGTLYDELIRVPLVMVGPGLVQREIATPVSLIDLGPTILDWFGLPTPASFMGESLVPLLLGEARRFSRPIVSETGLKQAMLFDDGYKVIRDLRRQTLELYNLSEDPGELRNLSDDIDPDQDEHVLLLRSFFQVHTYRENGYRVPYVK